jgi:hypothetical protein
MNETQLIQMKLKYYIMARSKSRSKARSKTRSKNDDVKRNPLIEQLVL